MDSLSIVLLLVLSGICAANWSDICSPVNTTSCPDRSCSCAGNVTYYQSGGPNCSVCVMGENVATYQVEFVGGDDSNCSFYFNETYIGNWNSSGFSHPPSCNIADNCCDSSDVQDYFFVTGLNNTIMLNVTSGYPYVSVIAVSESGSLTIGVSLLQLCSSDAWEQNVTACAEYFLPINETESSIDCAECGNYYFGCFNFTLTGVSECDTASPSSSTPMSTPMPTMEAPTTVTTPTPTAAGSTVTHCLGLMVFLLALSQLFRATLA